jgi:glutathione S-transferase
VFLPCLWLCASYGDARVAACLGTVWIIGRVLYARAYERQPASRILGFRVQAGATLLLALGGLGGAVAMLVRHGA